MRLQLDTDNKTITLEEDVKLGKLTDTLESLLPNGRWAEFTLLRNTVVNWQSPIIIEKYPEPTPYWQPWINYPNGTGAPIDPLPSTTSYNYTSGVFNIDIEG